MSNIQVNNLSVDYSGTIALDNISFHVEEHTLLGIIGPNGGGKSTILKVLLNLIQPSSGSVKVKEGRSLTYVPQYSSFDKAFPVKVWDVIMMGALPPRIRLFHKYSKEEKETGLRIMETLGLVDFKDRQIGQLSGGQLQKVLIARALNTNGDIILLDEPTANLDSKTKKEIYEILQSLKLTKTIVMVTHDIYDMSTYIDDVLCLNKRIYYHGDYSGFRHDIFEEAYGFRTQDVGVDAHIDPRLSRR